MQESKHDRLLKAHLEISQHLTDVASGELLQRILELAQGVFGFDNAIIRLLDEQSGELVTVASFGYPAEAERLRICLGEGIMGRVAARGEPILVADVLDEPGYLGGIEGARSELAVPLVAHERVIGVFNVESRRPGAFDQADIGPMLAFAGLAAIALENERLLAFLDRASDANRQLDQLNRQILRHVNLGVYTLDTDLKVTSWNPAMERLSGRPAYEVLGCDLLDLFPHLRGQDFERLLRQVVAGGSPGVLELPHRNLRGELRFQKRQVVPLRRAGMTTGVLVVVEDLTEFRRLLDRHLHTEKLAEIGRLTAGIAHEINNPLTVIGYAAQLLERELPGDEGRDLIERVGREVERLQALTEGLLSFSRREAPQLRPTDLQAVLEDVLLLLHYELQKRSIHLVRCFHPVPAVAADVNKLKQVFINLLQNAAQALGRDGVICVKLKQAGENQVVVEVADNGPGIAEDLRGRIFEPFFTTKQEGEGTGLGLYLCRQIVQEHDGEIELDSRPGMGALFRLTFPAHPVNKI
ncbi:GAF domain-containing sensor histidine kinase [Geothermobacter ehrlichii]|uniref:GAF domain-containing sensor histidine kinase n=1 Tax=Geothermobacter ehrlichii TaxID=213224 RepID=UPI0016533450|nr:GAF domain-containing sensor histidine kinase [Geothermobacter ehrlichii]